MIYKAKVAVCSQIHRKHSTQREHHVEFFNVKPAGTVRKETAGLQKVANMCLYTNAVSTGGPRTIVLTELHSYQNIPLRMSTLQTFRVGPHSRESVCLKRYHKRRIKFSGTRANFVKTGSAQTEVSTTSIAKIPAVRNNRAYLRTFEYQWHSDHQPSLKALLQ
jgi:hypothetical protein